MIVDASALMAIVLDAPQAAACLGALLESKANRMPAATLLEAAIVADHLADPNDRARFDGLFDRLDIVVEPLTARQAITAREA